jgi:nucleoside-diphosphate-sugar epimerase
MNVAVIGCGWLGFPLAKTLIKKGYSVFGSTTSSEKITFLESHNISSVVFNIYEKETFVNLDSILAKTELLILTIPPKQRSALNNYAESIAAFLAYIKQFQIRNIIYTSSTSVYPETNDFHTVTEESDTFLETDNQLVATETLLQKNFNSLILRLGGLVGMDRHPVKYLAGKSELKNPDAPVNLVHIDDVIESIAICLEKNITNEILNVVNPFHPKRKDYYISKAKELGLPLPSFLEHTEQLGKTVSSEKALQLLGKQQYTTF